MNITLIGMPGSGKSFVGKELARSLGYSFIDPDKLLEESHGKPLQEVLDTLGTDLFLQAEADLSVATLEGAVDTVLATGGSIVYSSDAMEELGKLSITVYLDVGLEILRERIGDAPRGVIGLGEKTLAQLFQERSPLYEKWAKVRVDGSQTLERVVSDIAVALDTDASR